jgi:hypothetical protein
LRIAALLAATDRSRDGPRGLKTHKQQLNVYVACREKRPLGIQYGKRCLRADTISVFHKGERMS